MIYKCPNCHGALEYNPETDKMQCSYCNNDYFVWELDENAVEYHENIPSEAELEEERKIDFTKERTIYDEPEFIECKVYTCSTCGAELTVGDSQVSTYCAYCGQPTIVYNRVDKTQKPKYIIPFKITKEEAEIILRDEFDKGFFVPKEVKEFEPERITGIYLPYFIYNVTFYHKARVRYSKNNSKIVEANCCFKNLCHDASNTVEDELSYGLEPYDLKELIEFDPKYLSGFYADRFDLSARQLTQRVGRRCKQMVVDELSMRCRGTVSDLIKCPPVYEITKADYAFLPVWFMTFQYQDKSYTMMVNGQTGKVVGTAPLAKNKLKILFVLLMFLISIPIIVPVTWFYLNVEIGGILLAFFAWWFGGVCLVLYGRFYAKYKVLKENLDFTRNRKTEKYVKERHGEYI